MIIAPPAAHLKKALFFSLLAISISCQYELPDDKYFKDVKKDTVDPSVISLSDYSNNDTIRIYQFSTQFRYSIDKRGLTITKVNVLLGNDSVGNFTNTNGSFLIDSHSLKTDLATAILKIQITYKGGTGSLADKLGLEKTSTWRTWVLVFDTTPPPSPVVTLSKTDEGFLKVSWSPYLKASFREYAILPGHPTPDDFTIKDPTVTSYVDSSYVGGVQTCYVSVVNAAGQNDGHATVNTPQAVSFSYRVPDSTVTLVWRKSRYAGAFKNVVITENGNIINTVTSPTDTTYSFRLSNAGLGTSPVITLTINAKHPYQGYEPFTFTTTIDNPKAARSILPNQTFYYSQALNAIVGYRQSDGYARIFNAAMKVKDSIYVGLIFSLPYPGKYAYYRNANGNGVVQRDLTNNMIKTFTIGASSSYVLGVVGAANGFVGVECYDASHNYVLEVINMNTNAVIQTNGTYLLSDDGNYYLNGQYFSSYNGSQFVFKTYEPVPDLKFRADNSNELIAPTTPTDILQGTTGSVLRTITPPEDDYTWKAYDPATHMLLYTKDGTSKCYLINIDTQTVKTVYGIDITFINGTLIDSNGHFIKLM